MNPNLKDKNGKTLKADQVVSKVSNRANNILLEIKLYILWIIGYFPLSVIRMVFYRLSGMNIGQSSVINIGVRIYNSENITIGEDTIIGEFSVLDGRSELTIGNHVDIASQVMIYNSEHDINDSDFKAIEDPVSIGDYVFIGPRAIILPGVKIGKGAVVAAGAVVTKDVADFDVVGGVPAKKISERNLKNPSYRIKRRGIFELF